ncbi:leucine-rich repeat domain-containing protein [Breznakiellaceae bacterium SP9]
MKKFLIVLLLTGVFMTAWAAPSPDQLAPRLSALADTSDFDWSTPANKQPQLDKLASDTPNFNWGTRSSQASPAPSSITAPATGTIVSYPYPDSRGGSLNVRPPTAEERLRDLEALGYGQEAQVPKDGWYARYYIPQVKGSMEDPDVSNGDEQRIVLIGYDGKQTNNVVIPAKITDGTVQGTVVGIDVGALSNRGLTGSITIPDTVEFILSEAFANNRLTSVIFPARNSSKIWFIGNNAFANNDLTQVAIPMSLYIISAATFANNKLETVVIPRNIIEVKDQAFANNSLRTLTFTPGTDGTYGIWNIGNDAFAYNQLETLTIPYSVVRIGSAAFSYNNLNNNRSGTIENGVSFSDQSRYQPGDTYRNEYEKRYQELATQYQDLNDFLNDYTPKYEFPEQEAFERYLTRLSDEVFSYNKLLKFTIPNTITMIGARALYKNELVQVQFGAKVARIDNEAFRQNKLVTITIPDGVENIGIRAFYGETDGNQLAGVTFGLHVNTLGESAFAGNQLRELALPDELEIIGKEAFANNQLVTVDLGTGVRKINSRAFANNQLTSLVLPSSLGNGGVPKPADSIEAQYATDNNNQKVIIEGPSLEQGAFADNKTLNGAHIILSDGVSMQAVNGVFDDEVNTELIEF